MEGFFCFKSKILCPNCHSQTDTFRAKNKKGCITTTTKTVTTHKLPTAQFENGLTCSNLPTNLFDKSTSLDGKLTDFTWYINTDLYTTQNPTHVFETAQSFDVKFYKIDLLWTIFNFN